MAHDYRWRPASLRPHRRLRLGALVTVAAAVGAATAVAASLHAGPFVSLTPTAHVSAQGPGAPVSPGAYYPAPTRPPDVVTTTVVPQPVRVEVPGSAPAAQPAGPAEPAAGWHDDRGGDHHHSGGSDGGSGDN